MAKYTFKEDNDGYESGYESDGGTEYTSGEILGSGAGARGRILKSKDNKKKKAVLDPIDVATIDYHEVHTKYNFFKTLYPDSGVELIKERNTYRLIVPLVPGIPYCKFIRSSKEEWIKLFISATQTLKACHEKGYVVVDLHAQNIHYDSVTNRSYLIDGGLAAFKDKESISTTFFCNKTEEDVNKRRKLPYSCAPECWSTANGVIARTSMDVYALALMMEAQKRFRDADLDLLLKKCKNLDPNSRPTLETLENELLDLLNKESPALQEPLPQKQDRKPQHSLFAEQLRLLQNKITDLNQRKMSNAHQAALILHKKLSDAREMYFNNKLTLQTCETFKKSCETSINEASKELNQHRGWSEFLTNLALAIGTLSLGLLIKGTINKANNRSFFFVHETCSSKIVGNIEKTIESIVKP